MNTQYKTERIIHRIAEEIEVEVVKDYEIEEEQSDDQNDLRKISFLIYG